MNHGSLFSGIGGFDLAAEWIGWTNVFHCEWNPFGQRVLQHYWPNAISYHDITTTDFSVHRGSIDILTGGFPCQPYSQAGKRLGKEDARHLWPEMLRAIREIQPTYVVGENVSGLISWNGGLVFDEVQSELEAEGYEVQSFILPACAVGAPHRRDRVWIIAADTDRQRRTKERQPGSEYEQRPVGLRATQDAPNHTIQGLERETGPGVQRRIARPAFNHSNADTYAGNQRLQRRTNDGITREIGQDADEQLGRLPCPTWQDFPTVAPICGADDGLPRELDGVTFSKWRTESVKAYGNAIVPQVAYKIFRAIQQTQEALTMSITHAGDCPNPKHGEGKP